ncbi:MAG: hypothetical protein IJ480_06935 [Clostridia bacterium]|nr:hypothetical protein [Clostridia bacterium]
MFHSYVMGADDSVFALEQHGFHIRRDGENYMVSFPPENAELWEAYIRGHLAEEYWNEYLAEDRVVFLFHLPAGFRRYEAERFRTDGFRNDEVLALCEELCGCRFDSLQSMLEGNHFYRKILRQDS